jgi:hypothetical protein
MHKIVYQIFYSISFPVSGCELKCYVSSCKGSLFWMSHVAGMRLRDDCYFLRRLMLRWDVDATPKEVTSRVV